MRSSQIIKKIESKKPESSLISVEEVMRVMNFARSHFRNNVGAQGKFMADYLLSLHQGKGIELNGNEAQAKPQEEHKEEDYEAELVALNLQTYSETLITPSPTRQLK